MVIKSIKARATLLGLVLSLVIGIFVFTGMFIFLNQNVVDSNATLDSKYTDSYNIINGSLISKLDNNIKSIQYSVQNLTEADTTFQVALNGFKGLGSILILPVTLVDTALEGINALITPLDFIPRWAKILAVLAITIVIILIIVAMLKGESNTV